MKKLFIFFNFFSAAVTAFFTVLQLKRLLLCLPILLLLLLLAGVDCKAQSTVQLAQPVLKYPSLFFKTFVAVEMKFEQAGTQIHYTLNNQTPTTQNKVYTHPIKIKKSFTTLKAIVSGDSFLSSEIVSATFIKEGFKIKLVQQTPANERFNGTGLNTLIDNKGGIADMNSKTWLGYQQDSVEINITLEKKQKLTAVLINCLQDQGSWVFLPAKLQLFYFDENKGTFELLGEQLPDHNKQVSAISCQPILLTASKKIKAQKIKIILKGIKTLPAWHAGNGQPGWLFVDEIKVY